MVILISGASCTGKTNLAKKVMEHHNVNYYSIDHLKMGLYRGNPNCGFTPTDSNEHVGRILWPVLRGIIMTAVENKQDLIVEGAYIFPEYLIDMDSLYLDEIHPVFICFSKEYVEHNYESGIIKYRHVAEERAYEEDWAPEVFIKDHELLRGKCEKLGTKCFQIKSDYELEMETIFSFISDKLSQGV